MVTLEGMDVFSSTASFAATVLAAVTMGVVQVIKQVEKFQLTIFRLLR